MDHHLRAQTLHSSIKITVPSSSFIQTILSAPESHRIMPSRPAALPPVGNRTLPEDFVFFIIILYISFVKQKFGNRNLLFTLISSANFVILYV